MDTIRLARKPGCPAGFLVFLPALSGLQKPIDMRDDSGFSFGSIKEIRLRTSAMYAPWGRVGPDGWRQAPGAGARELTQPLTVRKDPNSGGSEAEIEAQMRLLFDLRKDLRSAADMVNHHGNKD